MYEDDILSSQEVTRTDLTPNLPNECAAKHVVSVNNSLLQVNKHVHLLQEFETSQDGAVSYYWLVLRGS